MFPKCLEMTYRLKTVITKITKIGNEQNRNTLNDFHLFLQETNVRNCHYTNSLLIMISFADWLGPRAFAEVRRDEVKGFLISKFENGKCVGSIIKDSEGKWVSAYNLRLAICRRFFRWFYNRRREQEYWKTPSWFNIKNQKSDRATKGPYLNSQIWSEQELLSILKYEPMVRNKAIITMMWDMAGRNHEITSLKIRTLI